MKKSLFLYLLLSIVVFSCKKKDDNPASEDKVKQVHQLSILSAEARSKFLEVAPQANGDPRIALIQTMDWLLQQEGVESAFHQDSIYLFFKMTSGLQSMVWFKELDAQGASKFRGGGSGALKALATSGCSNVVENKDVLIYAPGNDEFLYELRSKVPSRLASSSLIDKVDHLKNEQATVAKISTFSNYGLVLMETHGTSISFLTGEGFEFGQSEIPTDFEEFSASILGQIGQDNLDYLIDGKLTIGGVVTYDPSLSDWWTNNQEDFEAGKFSLWATSKFLEGQPSLSNTILIGNFCFSGWTTVVADYPKPIGLGFQNLNPITYYAYQKPDGKSQTVDNDQSMAIEDSIIVGLLTDNDSTGIAHLKADGSTFQTTWPGLYLQHLGQPNWCYASCGEDLVDSRDGKVYKTVCIGDQVWMAENLNYSGAGVCYDNNPANCDVFGRMYTIFELTGGQDGSSGHVQGLCPQNWHVPSDAEVEELLNSVGGQSIASDKLKADTIWAGNGTGTWLDEFGFSALPAGRGRDVSTPFAGLGTRCEIWTSTVTEYSGDDYYSFFTVNNTQSDVDFSGASPNYYDFKLSCRCVKD